MGTTNATVKNDDNLNEDIKYPVNSIQTQAYVKRLCIYANMGTRNIYNYDVDNLYPQKVLAIRDRSNSLSSATKTFSDFITGDGWSDENLNSLEVNSEGQNMYDILRSISNQKSCLGFSLHFNFNIQGIITEINEIDFEDIRVTKDNKLEYNQDWSRYNKNKSIIYNRFSPDPVIIKKEIIESGGIEDYEGQVLYWTGTNKIYPLASFDAALDSGQYQAEKELFKLRNIQNDFTASGLLTYPITLNNMKEWSDVKEKIKQKGVGSDNAGRIILMGVSPDSETNRKFWEPFERQNSDDLFVNQNKDSKEVIFSVLRQPQILGGIKPDGGWPNQQELEDAFVYYNSIVEQDRKEVEKQIKKIFANSIWANFNDITILPKMLIKNEGTGTNKKNTTENGTGTGTNNA
jgi:hypothetical protein